MKFELDKFNRDVTEEELIRDLVEANAKAKVNERSLTFRSYKEFGKFSATTIASRFGSWNDGLQKAGLVPNEEKNISIEALFDNLKEVWIAKGSQPTLRDMSISPSRYKGSTYCVHFGGWRRALEEFVACVEQEKSEFANSDAEIRSSKFATKSNRNPSLALRFSVLARDSFRCVTCGRSPATLAGLVLEVDHIYPWSKGGETLKENLQTLCFDCNRGKGVTFP